MGPPNQTWSGIYNTVSKTITFTNQQTHSIQHHLLLQESRWHLTAAAQPTPCGDWDPAIQDWQTNIPVTLVRPLPSGIRVSLHHHPGPDPSHTLPTTPSTFPDYIATLPEISQRLLTQFEFVPGGERSLRACLATNRKIRTASDGSLDPEAALSSFGWQLLGNGNVLVRGAGPVDGVPDLLSSTRAELFGVSAVLEFLFHFCLFSNLSASTSNVVLWVDNRAAITKVNRTRKAGAKRRRISHDADIICQITDRLDRFQLKIRLQWVKAHQDQTTPYHNLAMAGRMNVDVDRLAERFWQLMTDGTFLPIQQGLHNPLTAVSLLIDGIRIPSHYSHRICSTIK
jgi:hypothetical protein